MIHGSKWYCTPQANSWAQGPNPSLSEGLTPHPPPPTPNKGLRGHGSTTYTNKEGAWVGREGE